MRTPPPNNPFTRRLSATLADRRERDLYRQCRSLESPQGVEVRLDGRRLLNFCSNDYLGLASDPRVIDALKRGADQWGVGAGAAHLVCGHSRPHQELEEALADFTGRQRALIFSSGYAANMGVINGLLSPGDQVFQDRLNHASLLDGGWLSRAAFHWYAHNDRVALREVLAAQSPESADSIRLIVSDGVFSMDGDQCSLDHLVTETQAANGTLMIDDAHGIGVLGERGQGSVDPARYSSDQVPVLVGTLGKALGTAGAFVAGDNALIEFLQQRARNFIYSTAMPPAIAVATLTSLQLVQQEAWRRQHLQTLIGYFRRGAASLGLPLLPSTTPIQPLLMGEAGGALALSRYLEQRGCWVTAIRPPTVPDGSARLRIALTAGHTHEHIDQLLTLLSEGMGSIRHESTTTICHGN